MPQPTATYRQHHDVEAPRVDDRHNRPAWRVLKWHDKLLDDKAITTAQWHAAKDFCELCELCLAVGYTRSSLAVGPGGAARSPHGAADAPAGWLDARACLREIGRRLGLRLYRLLIEALVEEQSWAALGRGRNIDPHTARAWVIAAIQSLPV